MDGVTDLIDGLREPRSYDHPVEKVELLQTPISWVLLAGRYAYKIKKPVDFGFVDFTTLAKRHHYCCEELRLNRRLAPALYLDVVPITGTVARPRVGGDGRAIDYAVKMRRFEQRSLLQSVAGRGELERGHVDQLADQIAAFHHAADPAPAHSRFGLPQEIERWTMQNFRQIRPLLVDVADLDQLRRLGDWSERQLRRRRGAFAARKSLGSVRDCHGDLHLGNIALIDDRAVIFDGIEFNADLRIIDVVSEIAFLMMDLHYRGYPGLAFRFLDRYLMHRGDYAGLAVLPFYRVYRALVRAKVNLLRLTDLRLDDEARRRAQNDYRGYFNLASAQLRVRPPPALLICHGLSASGKSALAAELVENVCCVRVRADVERKRLFGLNADARSGSAVAGGLYTAAADERTYRRLAALAGETLDAGFSVVADATFLRRWQRDLLRREAESRRLAWHLVDTDAPLTLLQQRIALRRREHPDEPSEATLQVLRHQLAHRDGLDDEERARTLRIDTSITEPAAAADAVAGLLPGRRW